MIDSPDLAGDPPRVLSEGTRIRTVQDPIIPIVGDLIQQNPGTISLGQGVAYYGPPARALERARAALDDPDTHGYQAVDGIPPLLSALEAKLAHENGVVLGDGSRLVVTAGGNMAFMNAIMAITDPGDEVIFPVPYYFNHEMAAVMASCRPVLVPTTEAYQLRIGAIRAALTTRTRAVVTVSPNNPSGAVYPESALRQLNSLCQEHGLYHVSDEVYEYFTYGAARHYSPGSASGSAPHTISIFSLSKAYGFAGWRVGYMVIPVHLETAVRKVQDTILVCPPVVSQLAAVGALEVGATYCRERLEAIAEVRSTALAALREIADLCPTPPAEGAFYLLLRVDSPLEPLRLVERLIREHRVAVTPGTAFGMHDGCYIRVAYGALAKETAVDGIGRLVRGLRAIVG